MVNAPKHAISNEGEQALGAKPEISFWLRYYAPSFDKQIDGEIKRLLAEVERAWNLQREILELRLVPSKLNGQPFPDAAHEEEIYKRDFLPRKNVLKARTGTSLRDQLRSNSGRFNLAGTLAIVSQSGIEWLCPPYGRDPKFGFHSDARLDFLKAALERGPDFLSERCPSVTKGQPEAELIDLFLSHRVLDGEVRREVPIGGRRSSPNWGYLIGGS